MATATNTGIAEKRRFAAQRKGDMVSWKGCPGKNGEWISARVVQLDAEICFVKPFGIQGRVKAKFDDLADISYFNNQEAAKKQAQAASRAIIQELKPDPKPVIQQIQEEPEESTMETTDRPPIPSTPISVEEGWYIVDFITKRYWAGGAYGFQPIERISNSSPMVRWGMVVRTSSELIAGNKPKVLGRYDPKGIHIVRSDSPKQLIIDGMIPKSASRPTGDAISVPARQITLTQSKPDALVQTSITIPDSIAHHRRVETDKLTTLLNLRAQFAAMSNEIEQAKLTIRRGEELQQQILTASKEWREARDVTTEAVAIECHPWHVETPPQTPTPEPKTTNELIDERAIE
jgi:hypothetical protein